MFVFRYIVSASAAQTLGAAHNVKGSKMRIIAPLIIALFGAGIGVSVNYFFTKSWLTYPAAATIGGVSAFLGLILRDVFDATLFSNDQLFDALLASISMALLVSVIAHVVTSFYDPNKD